MRSNKYRVWDIDHKQFIYFDLDNLEQMDGLYGRHGLFENGGFGEKQQFCGLKDKNGKEIYEGDIMVSSSNKPSKEMIGEVYFEKGMFRVQYRDRYPEEGGRKDFYLSSAFGGENWEVIGNIYENMELLETK